MLPTPAQIARAPKVVLHDHLDGGVRPQTVIELADAVGHELPTTDVHELQAWFTAGANRRNLAGKTPISPPTAVAIRLAAARKAA